MRDARFRRDVVRLHRLGPRTLHEALVELAAGGCSAARLRNWSGGMRGSTLRRSTRPAGGSGRNERPTAARA
jgi:hypothetical protein